MSAFRTVTETFAVSPQIALSDLATAKAEGFDLVIGNRPDDEEPGQPDAATVEAAVRAQGLDFVHIPIRGMATRDQVLAMHEALAARKTLAFCRSGTRSVTAWALGEILSGARDRPSALAAAARAGYDLSGLPDIT